jgi:hypothetical protein
MMAVTLARVRHITLTPPHRSGEGVRGGGAAGVPALTRGEDVAGGAVVPFDGAAPVDGHDVCGGSQKVSMSASRCRVLSRAPAEGDPGLCVRPGGAEPGLVQLAGGGESGVTVRGVGCGGVRDRGPAAVLI